MIIDKSYFVGNLKIPNVQENLAPLGDRLGNQVNLDQYIAEGEEKVMRYALGYAAWKLFIDIFENDGTFKPGADQRWIDLTDGKEYTNSKGDLVQWRGLRYTIGAFQYSLIAEYVFSMFLNDFSRTFSGTGMVKEQSRAASTESSIPRISEAWNKFIDMYQGKGEYEDRPLYIQKRYLSGIDWFGGEEDGEISLYRFLSDNESDYPEVKFTILERQNSFGL